MAEVEQPLHPHERSDWRWGPTMTALLIILGLVVFALVASRGFDLLMRRTSGGREINSAPEKILPPPPRLQVNGPRDLAAFRANEQWRLDSYGWIDKSRGIVRIPIERGVELYLKEHQSGA